jgi:hypothetical protein
MTFQQLFHPQKNQYYELSIQKDQAHTSVPHNDILEQIFVRKVSLGLIHRPLALSFALSGTITTPHPQESPEQG